MQKQLAEKHARDKAEEEKQAAQHDLRTIHKERVEAWKSGKKVNLPLYSLIFILPLFLSVSSPPAKLIGISYNILPCYSHVFWIWKFSYVVLSLWSLRLSTDIANWGISMLWYEVNRAGLVSWIDHMWWQCCLLPTKWRENSFDSHVQLRESCLANSGVQRHS